MENALTRKEALRGMTIWGARSNFEEKEKGKYIDGIMKQNPKHGLALMEVILIIIIKNYLILKIAVFQIVKNFIIC